MTETMLLLLSAVIGSVLGVLVAIPVSKLLVRKIEQLTEKVLGKQIPPEYRRPK